MIKYLRNIVCSLFVLCAGASGQGYAQVVWGGSGQSYYKIDGNEVIRISNIARRGASNLNLFWVDEAQVKLWLAYANMRLGLSYISDYLCDSGCLIDVYSQLSDIKRGRDF